MTKNWTKFTAKKIDIFPTNCHLLIPKPPLRTSKLQGTPSALIREHPARENNNFFLFLWAIFALQDPIRIQWPDWIHIRIQIRRIRMFLGLPGPRPDPFVTSTDPDPASDLSVSNKVLSNSYPPSAFMLIYEGAIGQPRKAPFLRSHLAFWIRIRLRNSGLRIRKK